MSRTEYIPNDIIEYTLEDPGKALIFYADKNINSLGYDTQIIYKNIFNKSIKIDKVILTQCYGKYHELTYSKNNDGSMNISGKNESTLIVFNKKFEINNFFKTRINKYEKIKLNIDYNSLLNLEVSYDPLKEWSYICNFNLLEEGNIIYSINSTPISTNSDMANTYFMMNLNKIAH